MIFIAPENWEGFKKESVLIISNNSLSLFRLRTYETSLLVEESISDELPYSGKYILGAISPLFNQTVLCQLFVWYQCCILENCNIIFKSFRNNFWSPFEYIIKYI